MSTMCEAAPSVQAEGGALIMHSTARQSPQERRRAPIGQRPVKAWWAVQCCVCGAVGPVAREREKTARPAIRRGFELRQMGTISGWLCERCCQYRDAMSPPATRGDCEYGGRPCVHFFCRYNLVYDISRKARKDFTLTETCALDFARTHPEGATLKEVGALLGMTREGSRYVELAAKAKIRLITNIRFSFLDEQDEEDT
jgi:hypothetical protein